VISLRQGAVKTLVFETLWANPADGWSIAARAYTRMMLQAGWDVRLKSPVQVFTQSNPNAEIEKYLPLTIPVRNWDAYIFSCPLGGFANMQHIFEALEATRRPRMFYTMFERTHVDPLLAAELEKLEGVFVPCEKNGVRLIAAGMNDVGVVPLPYFDDDPHLTLPPPSGTRVFAWHGRWEPRKAPDRLIRAFMRAFCPDEAELILKLGPLPWTRTPFPAPEYVIAAELDSYEARENGWTTENWPRSIQIVDALLSAEEMLDLESRTDIYVSGSRGEGIDLPAFRARLAGRRIVTTASGGPEDFLDEDDILVQATSSGRAPEYEHLWGPDVRLIEYPISDLIGALVEARARPVKLRAPPAQNHFAAVVPIFNRWIERCITAR